MRQKIGWFDYRNAGELASHLVEDHENSRVVDLIILLSQIIASLIFSFYVAWKLILIFLSISPLIIIIKYTGLELPAYSTTNSIAQEIFVFRSTSIVTLSRLISNLQSFADASAFGGYVFGIIKRESKIHIF
ncbi:unnamed protein product [Rotaria sordida]|uniref:ABC transmembrane type-1 domain-containing protein n=1 Tax=Rotaria sordida TaxID=392033 RepID=A0A815GFL0_9BILA|nr:unnamed protein product [Rotaria sordida]CAF1595357.1 unnamed protein product [Rotaria sordida]